MAPYMAGTGPVRAGPLKPDVAHDITSKTSQPPNRRSLNHPIAGHRPTQAEVAAFLALSDERDMWQKRLIAAERAAYKRGYDDGAADAAVVSAQIYSDEQAEQHWRESIRNMNADSRDLALLKRLRERKAKGERLSQHETVVLHLAEHPVIWDANPHMQPHGHRGERTPLPVDEAERRGARFEAFLEELKPTGATR
jgi:hypothetical protein